MPYGAELARGCSDPVTRARAEIGANLWASAFVPDLPLMRRLEDALNTLPPGEPHLRARLLGRLTIVGGADVDATERVRAWADEAVAVARSTGDPVLIAQSLLDQTQSPTTRSALDAGHVAAGEVIRHAERAGRSDLALAGHQRRAGYYLNRGELGTASQSLGRAEVLAAHHRRARRRSPSRDPLPPATEDRDRHDHEDHDRAARPARGGPSAHSRGDRRRGDRSRPWSRPAAPRRARQLRRLPRP